MITNFKKLVKVMSLALKTSIFETGWDKGPSAAVLAAGQTYPQAKNKTENKKRRNYKGLKTIVGMCSWGKLRTSGYEKTKSPLPLQTGSKQKQGSAHAPCP